MEKDTQSIETLEKKYPEEWLLIEVKKADALGKPLQGKLLKHSKSKEEIIESSKKKGKDIALFYSGNIPKKGYAFCF